MLGHAAPGAAVVYAITVTNAGGASTSEPISVVDELPAGLLYQQVSAPGWTCTANPPMVACVYGQSLAPGRVTPPIRITVIVTARPGTTLVNVAIANSGSMSASGDNIERIAGPAAPAPLLSPLGLLAALAALLGVAGHAQRRRRARLGDS